MEAQPQRAAVIKTASTLTLLTGIYLFISPWIYGVTAHSWNNWIVGALIVIFAAMRLSGPPSMSGVSWANCILGIWMFASPWIYGYTGYGAAFASSLAVGIVVFVLALVSATAFPRGTVGQQPMTPHRM